MAETTTAETAAGLRALADFIEAHPDLPPPVYLKNPSIWCPHNLDDVQALMRAALRAGIKVVKHHSDVQRNVEFAFGPIKALALVDKSEVCERVVVGTETIQVPDPAFVPPETPMIDKVVEITEWRCHPLLAPAGTTA